VAGKRESKNETERSSLFKLYSVWFTMTAMRKLLIFFSQLTVIKKILQLSRILEHFEHAEFPDVMD
jgi:hypothetical protein